MAVTTVAFSDLETWLNNQPNNTIDTPYELNIIGLTSADIGSSFDTGTLGDVLHQASELKYLDLSATELPSVTSMNYTFARCAYLVVPPEIPNGVTSLYEAFGKCEYLKYAPIIPDSVTDMRGAFEYCHSLDRLPIIPNSVSASYSNGCYYDISREVKKHLKGTQTQVKFFNYNAEYGEYSAEEEIIRDAFVYEDDKKTYKETVYLVNSATNISDWLYNLPENTVYTAYKIHFFKIINNYTTENIKTALYENPTKYVDLSYTYIPSGISLGNLFYKGLGYYVVSLVMPPDLSYSYSDSLYNTFRNCTNLRKAPTIPSTVDEMAGTFAGCLMIDETSIELPNSLVIMAETFRDCLITSAPTIPNSVTNMQSAFQDCQRLAEAPELPSGLTNMSYCFKGCSAIENISTVPATVTEGKEAFYGCSSLKTIEEFGISASALDSSDFQNMFSGCTSLESIGHKVEYSDDWHLVYLDFDSNTVEGKIYSRDKTSVSITQTTITKNTLSLPLITDELMFDTSISTADLEDIIEGTAQQQGMLDTNYSWFGKIVVPPTGDNFIMYAKEPSKFKSNIDFGGGGAELEIVSTSKSFTPAKDKRIIVDTSGVTVTLNYGGTNGVVAEVFAMESCTLTYYTSSSATSSLSMTTCSKAVFVYYNGGWALNSNYGTTNTVTVDNMQSVSSGAVYNKIKYAYDTNFLVTSGNSATEVSVKTRFPINNFNYLIFIIRWSNDPYIYDTRILPTDIFATVNRQIFVQNVDGARARFRYVDNTHIKCQMENAVYNPYYEVIGIL